MSLDSDRLLLEAKSAILEENLRRLDTLRAACRWGEVVLLSYRTLQCASEVMEDAAKIMEQIGAPERTDSLS
ncbi:MAG: hypothetical protein E6K60_06710 [Nitrospirae bacterium]|nr:MAG: hypothetical protein E6K60_06710 [Nitrospirota bacterium]